MLFPAIPPLALVWQRQVGRALGLCLLALALGFAAASLRTHAMAADARFAARRRRSFPGRIVAVEPLPAGRRILLGHVVLHGDVPLARRLRLRLRNNDAQALAPGDRVQLRALLHPPFAPSYPGAWDQRRDEYFAGLGGGGFALGKVDRLAAAHASGLAAFWQRFREAVAARIMAVLPGPPGAVAATLLTGMNTAIPADDRAAFATAGLAHILAVAGLHIGIVMSTVFVASRFALVHWEWAALRWPLKEIAGVAAIAAGGFYMAMTGHASAHHPQLRDGLLVTLGLLAGRRALSMRSLGFAATLLLLTEPEAAGRGELPDELRRGHCSDRRL